MFVIIVSVKEKKFALLAPQLSRDNPKILIASF